MPSADYCKWINVLIFFCVFLIQHCVDSCQNCEAYFGGLCSCFRYDPLWSQGQLLFGIGDCSGLIYLPRFHEICSTGDLRQINLANNAIQEVYPYAFSSLHFLDTTGTTSFLNSEEFVPSIILSYNDIKTIAIEAFEGPVSGKLQRLMLDHNQLTTFPEAVLHLPALKRLVLSHNQIQTVPEELQKLVQLELLDLSHNQLRRIPPYINRLQNLTELHLQGNPIEGDLHIYMPLLGGCDRLRLLVWTQPTMSCQCYNMEVYANITTSQRGVPAIFYSPVSGSQWVDEKGVVCDRTSQGKFIGREVRNIMDNDVWRGCKDWSEGGNGTIALRDSKTLLMPIIASFVLHLGLLYALFLGG